MLARLDGVELVAPSLLTFELVNVCVTKMRRNPENRDALLIGFGARDELAVQTKAIDPDGVLDLAAQRRLSAYDASYLWLARKLGVELVTLDRKLAEAARSLP